MIDNISPNINNQANIANNKYIIMTPSNANEEPKNDTFETADTAQNPSAQKEIPEELKPKKKSKKSLVAALSLGGAALITILGVLGKGNNRWNKKLNKLIQEAIEKAKSPSGGEALNLTRIKSGLKDERVVKMANFMNNTANFKDCYILPILEKIPGLRQFAHKTSDVYRKTGVKMTKNAYSHANNLYGAFDGRIKKILDSIDDTAVKEQVEKLIQKRNGILNENFDPSKVSKIVDGVETGRIKLMDEMMDEGKGICLEVRDKFSDLVKKLVKSKGKDKEGFGHFVAEDILKDKKAAYIEPLKKIRNEIDLIDDEILDLLKKGGNENYSVEHLQNITKARTSAFKSLNSAIRTEANDLLDKLRDIKIGCAPTDILGILSSTGLLGLYMSQADTKDQKVEVALTTGVPLGLGMAATTFTTMKMYTGLKPLLVGAATTLVANTFGKILNKQYKKTHNVQDEKPNIPTFENTVGELNQKVVTKVKKHAKSEKA